MPERLTPLDASFLYLENPTAAMHVGSVMVFDPPEGGFDHERLLRLVSGRLLTWYGPAMVEAHQTLAGTPEA